MKYRDLIPITEFSINGQQYLIFSNGTQPFKDSGIRLNTNILDNEIVGEIKVKGKRYLVVHQKKNTHENHKDGLKSPMSLLTQREFQIIMLVAEGRTDKEIANQLKISKYTVSTHLRRIFTKLRVDSRAAMIYRFLKSNEWFQENGQIPDRGKQL